MTESSSFICCRFEECILPEAGALVSSGNHHLLVKNTDFVNCSSKTQSGGLRKVYGSLVMECCIFDECHGEGGNTNSYGTAFGTSDCDVVLEDITLFQCWKQASPFDDDVYALIRGTADTKGVNSSKCVSRGGNLMGYYNNVKTGASIQYIQGVGGEEYGAFGITLSKQAVSNLNIINNSFLLIFLSASNIELTVRKGCFFMNNRYDDSGTVYAFDCVSDSYPKATINAHLSTIGLEVQRCRSSAKFTKRGQTKFSPPTLLSIFIAI